MAAKGFSTQSHTTGLRGPALSVTVPIELTPFEATLFKMDTKLDKSAVALLDYIIDEISNDTLSLMGYSPPLVKIQSETTVLSQTLDTSGNLTIQVKREMFVTIPSTDNDGGYNPRLVPDISSIDIATLSVFTHPDQKLGLVSRLKTTLPETFASLQSITFGNFISASMVSTVGNPITIGKDDNVPADITGGPPADRSKEIGRKKWADMTGGARDPEYEERQKELVKLEEFGGGSKEFGGISLDEVLDPVPEPTKVPSFIPTSTPTHTPTSRPSSKLPTLSPSNVLTSLSPTNSPTVTPTKMLFTSTSSPTNKPASCADGMCFSELRGYCLPCRRPTSSTNPGETVENDIGGPVMKEVIEEISHTPLPTPQATVPSPGRTTGSGIGGPVETSSPEPQPIEEAPVLESGKAPKPEKGEFVEDMATNTSQKEDEGQTSDSFLEKREDDNELITLDYGSGAKQSHTIQGNTFDLEFKNMAGELDADAIETLTEVLDMLVTKNLDNLVPGLSAHVGISYETTVLKQKLRRGVIVDALFWDEDAEMAASGGITTDAMIRMSWGAETIDVEDRDGSAVGVDKRKKKKKKNDKTPLPPPPEPPVNHSSDGPIPRCSEVMAGDDSKPEVPVIVGSGETIDDKLIGSAVDVDKHKKKSKSDEKKQIQNHKPPLPPCTDPHRGVPMVPAKPPPAPEEKSEHSIDGESEEESEHSVDNEPEEEFEHFENYEPSGGDKDAKKDDDKGAKNKSKKDNKDQKNRNDDTQKEKVDLVDATSAPTESPSATPTQLPSEIPTAKPQPTAEPTYSPTLEPTSSPTSRFGTLRVRITRTAHFQPPGGYPQSQLPDMSLLDVATASIFAQPLQEEAFRRILTNSDSTTAFIELESASLTGFVFDDSPFLGEDLQQADDKKNKKQSDKKQGQEEIWEISEESSGGNSSGDGGSNEIWELPNDTKKTTKKDNYEDNLAEFVDLECDTSSFLSMGGKQMELSFDYDLLYKESSDMKSDILEIDKNFPLALRVQLGLTCSGRRLQTFTEDGSIVFVDNVEKAKDSKRGGVYWINQGYIDAQDRSGPCTSRPGKKAADFNLGCVPMKGSLNVFYESSADPEKVTDTVLDAIKRASVVTESKSWAVYVDNRPSEGTGTIAGATEGSWAENTIAGVSVKSILLYGMIAVVSAIALIACGVLINNAKRKRRIRQETKQFEEFQERRGVNRQKRRNKRQSRANARANKEFAEKYRRSQSVAR